MRMKTMLFAALASLAAVACSAPAEVAASTSSDVTTSEETGLRVEATWARAITGTPTIGFDATTPVLDFSLRVDDGAIRGAHAGFDGLERPYVLVPRADGSTTRLDLPFRYTTQEGFIQLHPVDVYDNDTFFVSEADLALVRDRGVTVGLETNVGDLTTHVAVEPRHF
jgi:hypothetical protein